MFPPPSLQPAVTDIPARPYCPAGQSRRPAPRPRAPPAAGCPVAAIANPGLASADDEPVLIRPASRIGRPGLYGRLTSSLHSGAATRPPLPAIRSAVLLRSAIRAIRPFATVLWRRRPAVGGRRHPARGVPAGYPDLVGDQRTGGRCLTAPHRRCSAPRRHPVVSWGIRRMPRRWHEVGLPQRQTNTRPPGAAPGGPMPVQPHCDHIRAGLIRYGRHRIQHVEPVAMPSSPDTSPRSVAAHPSLRTPCRDARSCRAARRPRQRPGRPPDGRGRRRVCGSRTWAPTRASARWQSGARAPNFDHHDGHGADRAAATSTATWTRRAAGPEHRVVGPALATASPAPGLPPPVRLFGHQPEPGGPPPSASVPSMPGGRTPRSRPRSCHLNRRAACRPAWPKRRPGVVAVSWLILAASAASPGRRPGHSLAGRRAPGSRRAVDHHLRIHLRPSDHGGFAGHRLEVHDPSVRTPTAGNTVGGTDLAPRPAAASPRPKHAAAAAEVGEGLANGGRFACRQRRQQHHLVSRSASRPADRWISHLPVIRPTKTTEAGRVDARR